MVDFQAGQLKAISKRRQRGILLLFALALCASLFSYQFFIEGGRENVHSDGWHYLARANAEPVIQPFNIRILGPVLAALISYITGVSLQTSFQLITFSCLLGSLLLLAGLLEKRQVSVSFQIAIVVALGSALAILLGYRPVLVDSLLLMLVCLFIRALDSKKFTLALGLACLVALTKEYGVFLALPWMTQVVRERDARFAVCAVTPFILIAVAVVALPSKPHDISEMTYYQIRAIQENGLIVYLKFVYVWVWGILWPVLLFATQGLIVTIISRHSLTVDQANFASMLVSMPILLLGDWERSFLVLSPFACLTVPISASQNTKYSLMLGIGGLATALARRLKPETIMPRSVIVLMIIVSVIASGLLLAISFRQFRVGRVGIAEP